MWYRIDRYTDHTLNPETGFPYDDSWVVFAAGDEDYRMRLEGGDGRPYVIRAGKHHLYPQMALGDFLDYHETAGHKTLLALSEEALEEALKAYEGHSCRDRFLRE